MPLNQLSEFMQNMPIRSGNIKEIPLLIDAQVGKLGLFTSWGMH